MGQVNHRLTVMQRGVGGGAVNTSQTVLSPYNLTVVVKQVRNAKLTPYYLFITVVMSLLHECRHNLWNCTRLVKVFMDYKSCCLSKAAFPCILISSLYCAKWVIEQKVKFPERGLFWHGHTITCPAAQAQQWPDLWGRNPLITAEPRSDDDCLSAWPVKGATCGRLSTRWHGPGAHQHLGWKVCVLGLHPSTWAISAP